MVCSIAGGCYAHVSRLGAPSLCAAACTCMLATSRCKTKVHCMIVVTYRLHHSCQPAVFTVRFPTKHPACLLFFRQRAVRFLHCCMSMTWAMLHFRYVDITGQIINECSFKVLKDDEVHGWLGASPDGLVQPLGLLRSPLSVMSCHHTFAPYKHLHHTSI